jgi:hypothetical protein
MPNEVQKTRWWLLAGLVCLAVMGVAGWQAYLWSSHRGGVPANAIMVIAPYWYNGTWVFDDPTVGLKREPFVAGVPEMIDNLVKDIPDARAGFRLTFSANPFPGHQKKLTWLRGDSNGNFYKLDDPPTEGWSCPAMFKYYKTPPPNLYVQADPIRR